MADMKLRRTQHQEVMDMETSICDARNSVSIMQRLLDENFTKPHTAATGDPNKYLLCDADISDTFFVSNLAMNYVRKIQAQWEKALEAGR